MNRNSRNLEIEVISRPTEEMRDDQDYQSVDGGFLTGNNQSRLNTNQFVTLPPINANRMGNLNQVAVGDLSPMAPVNIMTPPISKQEVQAQGNLTASKCNITAVKHEKDEFKIDTVEISKSQLHDCEEAPPIDNRHWIFQKYDDFDRIMSRLKFFTYAVGELECYEPKVPEKQGLAKLQKYTKKILMGAIVLFLLTQVLYSQIMLFGTEKRQTQQFQKFSTFTYLLDDKSIPFHYFEMYEEPDVLQRIDCNTREDSPPHCLKIECLKLPSIEDRNECLFRQGYIENPDDQETFYNYIPQDRGEGLLTDREYTYEEITDYLCENTNLTFYSFNSVVETMIELECEVLDVEDGYLRIHYHFGEHTKPFYRNDGMDLEAPEAMEITFNQTYANKQEMANIFTDELRGLKVKQYASYYNWHDDIEPISSEITSQENYDAFFNSPNNEMIFSFENDEKKEYFGSGYVQEVCISANPETEIMLNGQTKLEILGVPILYEDVEIRFMNLKQMFTNTKQVSSDENIGIMIVFKFDFQENQLVFEYFSYDDIISSLGGIAASLKIFTGYIATIVMIQYIYELAGVFKRKYQYKYQKSMILKWLQYFEKVTKKEQQIKLYYGIKELNQVEEIMKNRKQIPNYNYDEITNLYEKMFEINDRFTAVEVEILNNDPEIAFENKQPPKETRLEKLINSRKDLTTGDIVERIKQRISFFSIFKIHDRLDKYKILQLEGQDELNNQMVKLEILMSKKFGKQEEQINALKDQLGIVEQKIAETQVKMTEEGAVQKRNIQKLQKTLKGLVLSKED